MHHSCTKRIRALHRTRRRKEEEAVLRGGLHHNLQCKGSLWQTWRWEEKMCCGPGDCTLWPGRTPERALRTTNYVGRSLFHEYQMPREQHTCLSFTARFGIWWLLPAKRGQLAEMLIEVGSARTPSAETELEVFCDHEGKIGDVSWCWADKCNTKFGLSDIG